MIDPVKQQKISNQYIDQYYPVIISTLKALRENKGNLHIPYAQFLFSIIDYYGLLYSVAEKRQFKKRDPQNFKNFFSSKYFPSHDRKKASFLYFVRNGIMHQIFSKGSSVGTTIENTLFFRDLKNGNIPGLNLDYLDKITIEAIDKFTKDVLSNPKYIDNLFDILITENYGLNDQEDLNKELEDSYCDNLQNIFDNVRSKNTRDNLLDRAERDSEEKGWLNFFIYIDRYQIIKVHVYDKYIRLLNIENEEIVVNVGQSYQPFLNRESMINDIWYIKLDGVLGNNWLYICNEYTKLPATILTLAPEERKMKIINSLVEFC